MRFVLRTMAAALCVAGVSVTAVQAQNQTRDHAGVAASEQSAAQGLPQAPQCALSIMVLMQRPPQSVSPAGHIIADMQIPAVQVCPAVHAFAQLPQCAMLDCRSTQLLPQHLPS